MIAAGVGFAQSFTNGNHSKGSLEHPEESQGFKGPASAEFEKILTKYLK